MASDISLVIRTSLPVPRPVFVSHELLLAMLREPDIADFDKSSLADPLFTEIGLVRVMELVGTGMVSWGEIVRAADIYGFADTDLAKLAREIAP